MKEFKDSIRGYHRSSKAWYSDIMRGDIQITFGMYADDGSTEGEMTMEWVILDGQFVPQLCSFDDGWAALYTFSDLLEAMAEIDNQNITEGNFAALLDKYGFKDLTKYER